MSGALYRGGLLILLFGGLLSLNAGRFGGMEEGIWELSALLMLFGLLCGLWGTASPSSSPDSTD